MRRGAGPELAERIFLDMVHDYRVHGVYENVYADSYYVADYCASAALPLAGLGAMLDRTGRD